MDLPDYRIVATVAVITLDRPPGNAVTAAMAAGLGAQLQRAIEDPEARGIVITGAGKAFSAGIDLAAMGDDGSTDEPAELARQIEAARKPVVAAINGAASGPGLEIALAAHGRVAAPDAMLGLPQIGFGLPPGAGATQRLPRLIGSGPALDLMLSGRAVAAASAPEGLIDAVSDGDIIEQGVALARALAKGRVPAVPTRDRTEGLNDPQAFVAAVMAARRQPSPIPALGRIIDCVEAALLLPFDAGLEMERAAWTDCRDSAESRALRRLARAEAEAGRFAAAYGVTANPPEVVGIVGGTVAAAEIARACLDAGIEVILVGVDTAGLVKAGDHLMNGLDAAVSAGRLSAGLRDERLARLTPSEEFDALIAADFVIEAAGSDANLRREVMGAVGVFAPAHAVLASGGAGLSLGELAQATGQPDRTIVFNMPPRGGRLVELCGPTDGAPVAMAMAVALARKMGRLPVWCGEARGLILANLQDASLRAVESMLLQGVRPARIDAALVGYGLPVGPCAELDAEGVDHALARRNMLLRGEVQDAEALSVIETLEAAGCRGGRSGGLYEAGGRDGGARAESAEARALIHALAGMSNVAQQEISEQGILRRWLGALANEGARLVEEGIAPRPGAVDVVATQAMRFPRWRGGPMVAADLAGLLRVQNDLRRFAGDDPLWSPSPLFAELIKNGQRFSDL